MGKSIIGVCVLFLASNAFAADVADFENLTLPANSHWNGESNWIADGSPVPTQGGVPADPNPIVYSDFFASGGMSLNNNFSSSYYAPWDWASTSWDGWAYSNEIDAITPGFGNQYSVITGEAYSGNNFAIAYPGWTEPSTVTLDTASGLDYLMMTNTTYAYYSMKDGDFFATPMDQGDWMKVTITGKDASGASTGTIEFFLADYTSTDSDDWYVVDSWEKVELESLGVVKSLEFVVSGSDSNYPYYFAMDNLTVPEPATMAMLVIGGGLAIIRRRRKA